MVATPGRLHVEELCGRLGGRRRARLGAAHGAGGLRGRSTGGLCGRRRKPARLGEGCWAGWGCELVVRGVY